MSCVHELRLLLSRCMGEHCSRGSVLEAAIVIDMLMADDCAACLQAGLHLRPPLVAVQLVEAVCACRGEREIVEVLRFCDPCLARQGLMLPPLLLPARWEVPMTLIIIIIMMISIMMTATRTGPTQASLHFSSATVVASAVALRLRPQLFAVMIVLTMTTPPAAPAQQVLLLLQVRAWVLAHPGGMPPPLLWQVQVRCGGT